MVPAILIFLHLVVSSTSELDSVVSHERALVRFRQSIRSCDVNEHRLVEIRLLDHQIHSFLGRPQQPPEFREGDDLLLAVRYRRSLNQRLQYVKYLGVRLSTVTVTPVTPSRNMLIYLCIVKQNRIPGLTSTVIPDLIPPCNALKTQFFLT